MITRGSRELDSMGRTCLKINEREMTVGQMVPKTKYSVGRNELSVQISSLSIYGF